MKVFSNLAVSLDGKIASLKSPKAPLGTPFDRKLMQTFRAEADVVLFGATTLAVMGRAARVKKLGKGAHQPANVVLTNSGRLPRDLPFWMESDVKRFVFCSEKGYLEAVRSCSGRAFVVVAGKEKVEPQKALRHLKSLGFRKVLVEGGGRTIWAFLEASCLHEINVTLTPKILGGLENPGFVAGPEFSEIRHMKLSRIKRVGDELYLQYKVKKALKL